eukprot:987920-Pyramimonas_sp.AAC.1
MGHLPAVARALPRELGARGMRRQRRADPDRSGGRHHSDLLRAWGGHGGRSGAHAAGRRLVARAELVPAAEGR